MTDNMSKVEDLKDFAGLSQGDAEYNIALQSIMLLVGKEDKDSVCVNISDAEELQSIMMLVCANYDIKFDRTQKNKSYITTPGK
tara:strand:- start:1111 stop:1362 length:252 start_codon:yes stop_codon:yes gene_type:complete